LKIYLSSLVPYISDDTDNFLQVSGKKANLLGSLVNDRNDLELIFNDYLQACKGVMVDSGAVTVRSGLAKVDLDSYCNYILSIPKSVKKKYNIKFVALDVIGESEKSFINYMKMRDNGVNEFIPVFHYNEDLKYLERLISDGFTYIGLGGTHSKKKVSYDDFIRWWNHVFFTTNEKDEQILRYPGIDFHGFAVTSMRALFPFPWYSVDSTTWAKMSAYGKIMTPWGDIRVSNHYNAANCRLHIDRRDPLQRKNIINWVEGFGFTIDEASSSRLVRNVLNVHYFLWLEEKHIWEKSNILKRSLSDFIRG